MAWFGHIDCGKCGQRHPEAQDCQKVKALLAGITPRIVLMDGKPRKLLSTMETDMADWQFEKFKEGGTGFVTPDQTTVSTNMLRGLAEWADKVKAGEATDMRAFGASVGPVLRGVEQFLALGFNAKTPVREI